MLATLMPKLDPVILSLRQQLYHPGTPIEAVFVVDCGMISLVSSMHEGSQAELGIIENEGVLGASLLSGSDTPFIEAMVQLPGRAFRMGAKEFLHEIDTHTVFRQLLLRYAEALQSQIMQAAACNGRHSLEQRFARWLLMADDRAEKKDLRLTARIHVHDARCAAIQYLDGCEYPEPGRDDRVCRGPPDGARPVFAGDGILRMLRCCPAEVRVAAWLIFSLCWLPDRRYDLRAYTEVLYCRS